MPDHITLRTSPDLLARLRSGVDNAGNITDAVACFLDHGFRVSINPVATKHRKTLGRVHVHAACVSDSRDTGTDGYGHTMLEAFSHMIYAFGAGVDVVYADGSYWIPGVIIEKGQVS